MLDSINCSVSRLAGRYSWTARYAHPAKCRQTVPRRVKKLLINEKNTFPLDFPRGRGQYHSVGGIMLVPASEVMDRLIQRWPLGIAREVARKPKRR